jgi:hypothetical protein
MDLVSTHTRAGHSSLNREEDEIRDEVVKTTHNHGHHQILQICEVLHISGGLSKRNSDGGISLTGEEFHSELQGNRTMAKNA